MIIKYLKEMKNMTLSEKEEYLDKLELKNYISFELTTETLNRLRNIAKDESLFNEYLKEAEELEDEAPEETTDVDDLDIDTETTETDTTDTDTDDIDIDTEADATDTDTDADDIDTTDIDTETTETDTEETTDISTNDTVETEEMQSENSEGAGILSLLQEIEKKLNKNKPSEVEKAAYKALKKLMA